MSANQKRSMVASVVLFLAFVAIAAIATTAVVGLVVSAGKWTWELFTPETTPPVAQSATNVNVEDENDEIPVYTVTTEIAGKRMRYVTFHYEIMDNGVLSLRKRGGGTAIVSPPFTIDEGKARRYMDK